MVNTNYITLQPGTTGVYLEVMGYNYDWLQNLYLSSADVQFPSLTSNNRHSTLSRVSAICPPFDGFVVPVSSYSAINRNIIALYLNESYFISGTGLVDVIFESIAGYTKLSDKKTYIIINE